MTPTVKSQHIDILLMLKAWSNRLSTVVQPFYLLWSKVKIILVQGEWNLHLTCW